MTTFVALPTIRYWLSVLQDLQQAEYFSIRLNMEIEPLAHPHIHERTHLESSHLPSSPQSLPLPVLTDSKEECLALLAKIDLLEKRLAALQRKARQPTSGQRQRKKNRRRNEQLSKRFRCLLKECPKVYDSATSLKYHMRTKHQLSVKKKRLQDGVFEILPHK